MPGAEMGNFRTRALVLVVVLLSAVSTVFAEGDTPVISGAVGFVGTNTAGQTSLQPILTPVFLVPLGSHLLVETSTEFQGYIARPTPDSSFEGQYFGTLEYLQLDYIVNRHITIVGGRFLTPFNIYGERLGPMWIHNLQNSPLIYPIGTRTSGASDGGMIRGVLASRPGWEINYTAFFGAECNANQFGSGRAFGTRTGIFLTKARLEIGGSYERFLQNQHYNAAGAYVSWQPPSVPLDVKAEYAHSPQGHGYWIEAAYQFKQTTPLGSWFHRMQAIGRVQQFFVGTPQPGDSLPRVDTRVGELGMNYYLPSNVRLNASYGRQFSSLGDFNQWTFAITYRFTFPAFPGGSK